jgi:multisubunit Na+/H+ antiporter MnhB subunit
VIALVFFILSTEYEWARRYFEKARTKAAEFTEQAVSKPWSAVLSILGALGLIAAGIIWGSISQLPFSSWWVGGSLIVGGLAALATIIVSLRQARHKASDSKRMTAVT